MSSPLGHYVDLRRGLLKIFLKHISLPMLGKVGIAREHMVEQPKEASALEKPHAYTWLCQRRFGSETHPSSHLFPCYQCSQNLFLATLEAMHP